MSLALLVEHHLPFAPGDERAVTAAALGVHLPLLGALRRLEADGVPSPLTVVLSPTALAMLERERAGLTVGVETAVLQADAEVERTRHDAAMHATATQLRDGLDARFRLFAALGGDLVGEYRRLAAAGRIELATTTATRGFLPLLHDRAAMRGQVEAAVAEHARHFGAPPAGIRPAACGYAPGCEELFAEAGLRWFAVAPHGLLDASSPPVYGVFAPVVAGGVAAFARHEGLTREIEAAAAREPSWRLPGTPWRQTGPTPHKALYDPEAARARATELAATLIDRFEGHLEAVRRHMEAPLFLVEVEMGRDEAAWLLEDVYRRLHARRLEATTPSGWLAAGRPLQETRPAPSSGAPGGYAAALCTAGSDWILPHLHHAAERVRALARGGAEGRLVAQAGRELLLAQAADWPERLHRGDDVDGAVARVRDHLAAVHRLADEGGDELLADREARWPLFPALDPDIWRR
jgi:1,4-alpha-glucan branching enzyme